MGNFGVGTTIKSILLTLTLVWGDSLRLKLSPQWCLDVNGIDLIVVPTPKVAKVRAHLLVAAATAATFLELGGSKIDVNEYFHML